MATCSGTAILGNYFAVSLKMKHSDINDPEIPVLGIYLRKVKTCPHKNLYVNGHRNLTHNIKKD